MSAFTLVLGHTATLSLTLGGVGLVRGLIVTRAGPLGRLLAGHAASLRDDLSYLRSRVAPPSVVHGQAACVALLCALAIATGSFVLVLGVVPALAGPTLVVRRSRLLRSQKVEEQLDGWLLALAHALRVTPSLGEAMAGTARTCPSPLRDEIRRVIDEHALGVPLDDALEHLGRRSRSRAVEGAVLCLGIARNAGGPVSDTLEQAAAALRDIARLEGVVRVKTAEGKAQAFVMTLIPAPLVLAIHWIQPGYFEPLTRDARGALVIAAAALLWGIAIALALKFTAVEV